MNIPPEPAPYDQGKDNQYYSGKLDDLIDLVTTAHIQDNPDNTVYKDESDLWNWVAKVGFSGSPAEAKTYFTQGGNMPGPPPGHANYNSDDTIDIQLEGAAWNKQTWYKYKGSAWQGQRPQFEYSKPHFDQAMSYSYDGLDNGCFLMKMYEDDLTPKGNITENEIDDLTKVNVSTSGGKSPTSGAQQIFSEESNEWNEAGAASKFLEPWQGRMAEVFKGAYIDRLPSILVGQCMTAKVLEQSLTICKDSYHGVRWQTQDLLDQAIELFQVYPFQGDGSSGDSTDWKTILSDVSGVATVVAGISTFFPPAYPVTALATIVAGGAAIGANIVESPKHKESLSNEIKLEGHSASEIYANFVLRIQTYLGEVDNTEQILKKTLSDYKTKVEDKSTGGATIYLTFGNDLQLTQWESFFALKKPGVASIDSSDSYSDISNSDNMGAAPATGEQFSGDLNELFKVGQVYLPDLANNYGALTISDASDGVEKGFTRTSAVSTRQRDYTETGSGAVYPAWSALYTVFRQMLSSTEANMRDAGKGLTAAAVSFAHHDKTAAGKIDQTYKDLL